MNLRNRVSLHRLLICLIILSACGPMLAATLTDYQGRIAISRDELRGFGDAGDRQDGKASDEEHIERIQRRLPATEKVDVPGGSVDIDNRWIAAYFDQFVAESDAAKRDERLTAIDERLIAISRSIDELKAATADARSKDEDKQKLADILRRPEYQIAQPKEESLFQKWWRAFWEWLASVFPRPVASPSAPSGLGSFKLGLQVLIFAVAIGLVGFLIWRFAPFVSGRIRLRDKRDKQDRVILGERIGADASAADIFSEAEMLASGGDHRGAIRKGYIALLCELGERKIVRLARHKTNRDYLGDVRTRDELFAVMTGLTGNFERSWYGLRLAHAGDWEDFRERCRKAISSV